MSVAHGYLIPFLIVQAGALAALVEGPSALGVSLFAAVFVFQGLGITAGYHRYFSHRSFRTSRTFQLLLAVAGTCAVQKGVLWWAAHHRAHHRRADAPGDPHSPRDGFFWSHMGWFLAATPPTSDPDSVTDLARFPELVWLDRNFVVPPIALALLLADGFGWTGFLWGFCLATTASWHLTYAVNSLGHRVGTRPFQTDDDSRNNFALAILTFGEGWHNNHHRFPSSARQGLRWWQIDPTYYGLRILAACGVVWKLVEAPAATRPTERS